MAVLEKLIYSSEMGKEQWVFSEIAVLSVVLQIRQEFWRGCPLGGRLTLY